MDVDPDADSGSDRSDEAEIGGGSLSSPSSSPEIEAEASRTRAEQEKRRGEGARKGQLPAGEAQERSTERALDGGGFRDRGDAEGGDNECSDRRGEREGAGGGAGMRFENLNDIPDGELIPAAAATIALESCFLGGRRDQAMEIVWQVR